MQLCLKAIKKQPDNYIVLVGISALHLSLLRIDQILLQAFKALALSQAPRPLSPASITEILSISTFVMSNASGTGLNNPDVLTFLGWVLGSIGQRKR